MQDKTLAAIKKLAYGFKSKKITVTYDVDGNITSRKVETRDVTPDRHILAWLVNYENGQEEELKISEGGDYGLYE